MKLNDMYNDLNNMFIRVSKYYDDIGSMIDQSEYTEVELEAISKELANIESSIIEIKKSIIRYGE